jgi:hypothetical protein
VAIVPERTKTTVTACSMPPTPQIHLLSHPSSLNLTSHACLRTKCSALLFRLLFFFMYCITYSFSSDWPNSFGVRGWCARFRYVCTIQTTFRSNGEYSKWYYFQTYMIGPMITGLRPPRTSKVMRKIVYI